MYGNGPDSALWINRTIDWVYPNWRLLYSIRCRAKFHQVSNASNVGLFGGHVVGGGNV